MTLLSETISVGAAGGGLSLLQTGYHAGATVQTSSGEDARYNDITVSAVSDYTQCVVLFQQSNPKTDTVQIAYVTARMTSNTNIRLGTNVTTFSLSPTNFAGRYYILGPA